MKIFSPSFAGSSLALLLPALLCLAMIALPATAHSGDLNGTPGSDTLIVGPNEVYDDVFGFGGNDLIRILGEVQDDVEGGTGNDTIINDGYIADDIEGRPGDDTIINNGIVDENVDGGFGDDIIRNYGYIEDEIKGQVGNDTIFNAEGAYVEWIEGNVGDDAITNEGFVDGPIFGDDGVDTLINGLTGDALFMEGGRGRDTLINYGYLFWGMDGGNASDLIINEGLTDDYNFGDGGDDILINTGEGEAYGLDGERGNDTIIHDGVLVGDIFGGPDDDIITVAGDVLWDVFGDWGDGNEGFDILNIHAGFFIGEDVGEFETINKYGSGFVSIDEDLDATGTDFNIMMYNAATQFDIGTFSGDPGDIDVQVLGGNWTDGLVVDIFSTGAESGFDTETVTDTSPVLSFAISDAQVTASRTGQYQDFLAPGDNGYEIAVLLEDLTGSPPSGMEDLLGALDFVPAEDMGSAIRQFGPNLEYGLQESTLRANSMITGALAANFRNYRHPGGSWRMESATLASMGYPDTGREQAVSDYLALTAFAAGLVEMMGSELEPGLDQAISDAAMFRPAILAQASLPGLDQDAQGPETGQSVRFGDSIGVWARLLGGAFSSDHMEGFHSWNGLAAGIVAGADVMVTDTIMAGIYAGWTHLDLAFDDEGDSWANSHIFHGGLYGSWFQGSWYADASIGGFFGHWNTNRAMQMGPFSSNTSGDFATSGLNLSLSGGYDFTWDDFTLGPIVGMNYVYAHEAPYTEDDPLLGLDIDARDFHSLKTMLGARAAMNLEYALEDGNLAVVPEIRAQWIHEFLRQPMSFNAALAPGGEFDYETPDPNRDQALAGLGVTIQGPYGPAFYAGYDFLYAPGQYDHSLNLGVRFDF